MKPFSEIIRSGKPVLVDFSAEWCGPCKMMVPILKELKEKKKDDVIILKIDIDKNRQIAQDFQIQGVPTLILFLNGEVKWRQSGVVPVNQLEKMLNQWIVDKKEI